MLQKHHNKITDLLEDQTLDLLKPHHKIMADPFNKGNSHNNIDNSHSNIDNSHTGHLHQSSKSIKDHHRKNKHTKHQGQFTAIKYKISHQLIQRLCVPRLNQYPHQSSQCQNKHILPLDPTTQV